MKLQEVNTRTKEAVDFLVAALESGHSEVLTAYLGAMAKFHTYSFGNIMLIARQKPDATNVAGLRTWNSLGRFVKRGEKGIFILAPMVGRRSPKDVATDEPSDDATTEGQRTLYGFRAVYVFDVSQTEGKDLPTLTEVNGDVSGYRERLFKFVEAQSVELSFSERIAPAKGLSHGGKITLFSGMQPAEEFSTLVHEIAHEMLHRGDRRTLTTKQVRETEAEAVAFVVCQSVGLQNGTASQLDDHHLIIYVPWTFFVFWLWYFVGYHFGQSANGPIRRGAIQRYLVFLAQVFITGELIYCGIGIIGRSPADHPLKTPTMVVACFWAWVLVTIIGWVNLSRRLSKRASVAS